MEWIQKIKEDRNKALKEAYLLYRQDCTEWLMRQYQLREDEAVDVFQLSIIVLYDSVCMDKIKSETTSLKSFLYGVARNKAYETIRSHKNIQSLDDSSLLTHLLYEENQEIDSDAALELANHALKELGPPCSTIIQMYYYQNKSMEEISLQMGYNNANTTKNQKYKCLQRLQKLYFRHYKQDQT
jgi:RNA polymerase sigma-70 factor (ECF subfamily)